LMTLNVFHDGSVAISSLCSRCVIHIDKWF
jgi:hypothetical protein